MREKTWYSRRFMRLDGKVALVTGASRGIGAAIAARLAAAGARVALTARSTGEIEKLAKEIGGGASAHTLDVADAKAVDRVVDAVASAGGRLDIVVNNAGISERSTVAKGSDEWWDRMLRVNLTGSFYVARAALRHLKAGGRIVNNASVLGIFGVGDSAGYVAAKHGLVGLTRALAVETAAKGITVNAVCPGWVDTAMAGTGFESIAAGLKKSKQEAKAFALGNVPQGRMLKPEEVASLVLFLCGDDARGIHGQAIRIDGGATPW
jgi:NAD(P)-dependent dehydrogenase (short-subunit alcohol dehydrogenase family)